MSHFPELFERITERFSVPIKLSRNCEANTFYRVEDLNPEEISVCANYLAQRTLDACSPEEPVVLVEMPGSTSGLADALAHSLSLESPSGLPPRVVTLNEFNKGNGATSAVKGKNIAIVNDIITTGKSCLEAHTRLCVTGANVLCWVALIDRTFGPGPVAVVATMTGDPVKILD
jgi:hypoxanthine-guanine phosphoribosyltransferase